MTKETQDNIIASLNNSIDNWHGIFKVETDFLLPWKSDNGDPVRRTLLKRKIEKEQDKTIQEYLVVPLEDAWEYFRYYHGFVTSHKGYRLLWDELKILIGVLLVEWRTHGHFVVLLAQ